jgi:mono/diheme cytochrome c family protein
MPDGTGAGQLNPALVTSNVVRGDAQRVIDVVLKGPAAVLPADRPKYANQMPPFNILSDDQIADVVSYVRHQFGSGSSTVTPTDVIARRALIH